MKDYCITYLAKDEPDFGKRLMKIKQVYLKLPKESAEKLKILFSIEPINFLIEEFTLPELD